MTTLLPNEPKMYVEDALTAVSYAERMIRLADQFRREGNHAAANGAVMMTWNIRENTENAMAILPNLTPEHAALLGRSERQRLSTELNSSYENLNRLGWEHGSTEDQWDECYEQEADWYKCCFEVGLTAHLADAIVARAERQPQTEDNIEIVVDAVGKSYRVAQESMEHVRDNEPPADAPFPQTRQQSMQQAISDCAKLEQLDQQIREKLPAIEQEANNSLGRCHLCGIAVRAEDASAHVQSCVTEAFQRTFGDNGLDSGRGGNGTILISVRADEVRQWMVLAVRPNTSLLQLDQFLRDLWLECCDHISRFVIGGTRYSSRDTGLRDLDQFLRDLWTDHCGHMSRFQTGTPRYSAACQPGPVERYMMYTVQETIRSGGLFRHEYDYDHIYSTSLDLERVAVLPLPYDRLPELIDLPESAEGHTDKFITIVARNLPLENCFTCGEPSRWCYYENPYEHVGSYRLPPYFCDDCAPRNVMLLAMPNSPRAGVSCYDNVHDQPSSPSQDT